MEFLETQLLITQNVSKYFERDSTIKSNTHDDHALWKTML